MLLITSFRKAQRLSTDERRLLAQALVFLPLTLCGVYVLGIRRWQRFLIRLTSGTRTSLSTRTKNLLPATSNREDSLAAIERAGVIARIVKIAAEHGIFHANCLQQTLVLWFLLCRNGIPSDICFGARKEAGQLQSHAWIECFGIALNEDSEVRQHFSVFEGVTRAVHSEI
jgi:hypothetical protein